MIRSMLDFLVCPFDKESELELFELKTRPIEVNVYQNERKTGPESINLKSTSSNNSNNSGIGGDKVGGELPSSNAGDEVVEVVIEDGVLFCNSCLRFYPIVEEIPIILPDELRDKNNDLEILKKWAESLPDKVIKRSLPWHL